MALGLLGAALAGGGQAVQQNAQARIKEMHDKAMQKMRQKYQTSERIAGQEFQTQERKAGQEFTASENQAGRQHDVRLLKLREAGADRRASMQVGSAMERTRMGGWTTERDAEGNPVRYNPITGETAPVEGGLMVGGEGMSDREKDAMSTLRSQYRDLTSMFDPFLEEGPKQELQGKLDDVYRQMERINPLLARQIAEEETGGDAVDEYLNQF